MTITISTVIFLMIVWFVLFSIAFYLLSGLILDAIEKRISSTAEPTKGTKNDSTPHQVDLGADHHHSAR